MNNLKALTTLIAKPNRLKALLSYGHKGYLNSIGWFTAFDKKQAVDGNGKPLPWVTYSFIDFIKERINKSHRVFEYGSGNSTIFYAERACAVTSVEHDKDWYNKVKNGSPANAEMIFCELQRDGEYAKKAALLDQKFDIIIVDGRDRVRCCKYSLDALTPNGVIVLDDSEREVYNPARILLKAQGFKEISFSGISPGLFYEKATSVFYKADNCLGI
ncbi:class I SAM-dependent methyltransferase [Pedobacter sandarakinus]|uniref:FkbM family methyltransferase n=1 Tax=Pedobacter sandarakinus TaxID=353156 RepID=UPI0022468676|nr:FkbM family methyltransferase [Pedobacter sandarakinus]MCX2573967.1 FkbM family methyltransferase [Pedobacter sandarakinus]